MNKKKTAMSDKNPSAKEPFFHITRRNPGIAFPFWKKILIRLAAFMCAALIIAFFSYILFGLDPVKLYSTLFEGAFLGSDYIVATLKTAAKLLCLAVALAPAFKMRFWNTGAEGQMLVGAVAAAFIMHDYPTLPNWLVLVLMATCAMIAGAVWGVIPALFKVKFGTNETLFTLMMNYVAINVVNYFVSIWKGNKVFIGVLNDNFRNPITYEKGYIRRIWQGSTSSSILQSEDFWYIAIIVVIAVVMFFYLKKTKQGYEIAVVGDSQNTARYAGISVTKVMIRTMVLSGLVCGLCGFLTVSAQAHTVSTNITSGYGFTAIIVAWMSKFNTLTMAAVSVLVVALENGSKHIADVSTVFPESAAAIIVGTFLLFIVGSEFFINYKVNFRKKNSKEA